MFPATIIPICVTFPKIYRNTSKDTRRLFSPRELQISCQKIIKINFTKPRLRCVIHCSFYQMQLHQTIIYSGLIDSLVYGGHFDSNTYIIFPLVKFAYYVIQYFNFYYYILTIVFCTLFHLYYFVSGSFSRLNPLGIRYQALVIKQTMKIYVKLFCKHSFLILIQKPRVFSLIIIEFFYNISITFNTVIEIRLEEV